MVFRFVARMEFQLLDANFLILNGILFRKDNTVCYRTDVRFRALRENYVFDVTQLVTITCTFRVN